MGETKLWTRLIMILAIALMCTIGSCTMHQDYRISLAIENGVDPVLARAAYEKNAGSYERLVYLGSQAAFNKRLECK